MLLIGEHMKKHGKDEPTDPEEESGDTGESEQMEKSAVADLIKAIRNSDVEAAHAALKDFVTLCEGKEEADEGEEPEEDA